MKVIAVDPGKMTGVAVWRGFEAARIDDTFFSASALPRWEAVDLVENSLQPDNVDCDVLVCEEFAITARTAKLSREGSTIALETVGIMRYLAWKTGGQCEFVLQKPSDALGFVTDDKLRKLGWYTPGPDHSRDATRHLVLYLVNSKLLNPAVFL